MPDDPVKIPDTSGLLRRIHPDQIVADGNNRGKRRLSSGAFRDLRLSVDVEPMLVAAGLDWTFSLINWDGHFLVRLLAKLGRDNGQSVEHAPFESNPYHAEVVGKKTNRIAKAFRDAAEWVKKPADAI